MNPDPALDGRQKANYVLVVSHEASRTGAPKVALEVVRALIGGGGARVEVILRWPGPMRTDFAKYKVRVNNEPLRFWRVTLRRFRRSRWAARKLEEWVAYRVLKRRQPDVLYLNTVLSLSYLGAARQLGIPVVVHIHELSPLLRQALKRWDVSGEKSRRVRWVACSEASKLDLCDALNLHGEQVRVIPSLVDIDEVRRLSRLALPSELPRTFIVNCATGDRRKGLDLWLQIAARIADDPQLQHVHFIWIGRIAEPRIIDEFRGQAWFSRVRFMGEIDNPYPVIHASSAMAFSSRSDVFPLAVMEAMVLQAPIVAFSVGGLVEQLPESCLVEPENVAAMADRLSQWLHDPAAANKQGHVLAQRAEEHFGIRTMHQEISTVVRECLDGQ